MTVEEIEILVTAKVEEALKEFEKMLPAIKKVMKDAQEAFSKVDTKTMTKKLNQAVNFMKKKMQDLKKSSENNEIAIKVNNKDAKKQITQLEKEIDSLQKKITGRQLKLDITNETLDKIRNDTNQSVINEMPDAGNKKIKQETYNKLNNNTNYNSLVNQSDKLNKEIEKYNELLNTAKAKMEELEQQTSQTATTQNKISSFFSAFKQKVEQVKPSISNMQKSFKGMPKITQNITNNIKEMGKGLKNGLGHILKYAGALFGLRSIYSTLSSSASSWLSSQNAQAQQLSANIDYMKYAMGSVFAPVIEYVTNLIYNLMRAVQSLIYAFSGVNIFAKATASSMKSASGSASKASKSLVGIHNEINNVSDNSSSGGSGSTSPSMDLSQMDNTPNSIIDAIKNGNWYEVGSTIGKKLNDAMSSIPWDKIQDTARNIGTGIAQTLNGFIATTDWKQVGNTFAQGLNTAIYFAQSFVHTFNWAGVGSAVASTINGFFKNTNWGALGDTISTGIKGAISGITAFFRELDWSFIVQGLIDFCKNIDWNGIVDSMFEMLGSAFASFVNLGMIIGEKINEAMDNAKGYFKEKIEECGGNVVEGIFKGIGDALANIGQWINDHIFQPFIDGFKNVFGIHSPSTVMEEQGNFLMQGLLNGIDALKDDVKQKWEEIKKGCKEIFEKIGTKISETWENAKANTTEKWNNIKSTVLDTWKNMKEKASEKFNDIKTKISDTWNNIKNDPNNSSMASTLINKFQDIKDRTREKFDNIKSNISSAWNNIREDSNLSNMASTIKSTFTSMDSNTWGKDLVSNMANGIKNNISKVTSAVNSVANKIKSFLHFTEPDEGPLSNFHTYMPDMIDLMVKGIRANTNKVKDEIENLAGTMSYTINTETIAGINPVNSNGETIKVKPQTTLNALEDVLSDFNGSNGQPLHITIQYLGKEIFDDTIEYINSKTRRTGKNTIVTVGG